MYKTYVCLMCLVTASQTIMPRTVYVIPDDAIVHYLRYGESLLAAKITRPAKYTNVMIRFLGSLLISKGLISLETVKFKFLEM